MPKSKTKAESEPASFNTVMEQLEGIVQILGDDDTSLEESLKVFEEGVQLIRNAQAALAEAEQKVSLLLDADGEPEITDVETSGDEE